MQVCGIRAHPGADTRTYNPPCQGHATLGQAESGFPAWDWLTSQENQSPSKDARPSKGPTGVGRRMGERASWVMLTG